MLGSGIVMRRRIAALFAVTALALFFLLGRVAYLQFVRGSELQRRALENRMADIRVDGKRGNIYDRNGQELVRSVSADTLYAVPVQIKNPRATAEKLAAILGRKADDIYKIITRPTNFEYIEKKIADPEKVKKIRELKLLGIYFQEDSRRVYPNDNLASHVLGYVGIDNNGLAGIESTMEKELRGQPGWIVQERDARGREMPQALHKYIPPKDGNHLVLTIDATIQHFVERELDRIMVEHKAKQATIIVMDPKTGEILAMGNRPDFNPNQWEKYPAEVRDRNLAVWLNYEPGSTFKVVTAAAALEEGVVTPNDRFYDPGFIMVDGERINCWAAGGHGSQSFVEVVQNSCNPGFITIGLKLGKEKFYRYINAFGFGRPTGVELPGEGTGILYNEKEITNVNLATMSIGQSVSVTPIQLITAVAAVANDGRLMKPHIVKEIRSPDGKQVKKIKPEMVRQVISRDTARQLRDILEKVVLYGSGKNAAVEGYRVGGKTGTAQKAGPNGGYMPGKYVASFVGFVPVEDPRLVILVVVDEPEGMYYGSQVAAPHFQAVARDALRYLGIPPKVDASSKKDKEDKDTKRVTVPSLVNLSLTEAVHKVQAAGLRSRIEGEGEVVLEQLPKPGSVVPAETEVILYVGPRGEVKEGQEVTVPDLTGLTLQEASELLGMLGLRLETEPGATGYAVSQDVAPGTRVRAGTKVKVRFAPPLLESGP